MIDDPATQHELISQTGECIDGCQTDFSFFDAGVDGVQQVSPVFVTFGELSQFLPDQLPLVVAHHPFKGWIHVLGQNQEDVKI